MLKHVVVSVFVVVASVCMAVSAAEFDPAVDGWYFVNWGEELPNCVEGSCDLSWELYRRTYIGINPTHDCWQAPLDCAFYEVFKNHSELGNCGGMSLLALALFKYGGYMGFCSPANFYTGHLGITDLKGPHRVDLHQTMNILNARQFSAAGVERFLELVAAGDLNNAHRAFQEVTESLAKGDYPVLTIANSFWGKDAHTVIPYRVETKPDGTKIMYIWDPNDPYNADPDHYADWNQANRLVISPTDAYEWSYASAGYSGSGWDAAWCFAVPMSRILPKARHPMAFDVLNEALLKVFVSGPGATLVQIEDHDGDQVFRPASGEASAFREWVTDDAVRLRDVFQWPWGQPQREGEHTAELFFIVPSQVDDNSLTFTVSGTHYKTLFQTAGELIWVESESDAVATDILRLSGTGTAATLEASTLGQERVLSVRRYRGGDDPGDWRLVDVAYHVITRGSTVVAQGIPGDPDASSATASAK